MLVCFLGWRQKEEYVLLCGPCLSIWPRNTNQLPGCMAHAMCTGSLMGNNGCTAETHRVVDTEISVWLSSTRGEPKKTELVLSFPCTYLRVEFWAVLALTCVSSSDQQSCNSLCSAPGRTFRAPVHSGGLTKSNKMEEHADITSLSCITDIVLDL
jgi:hypothetical protein